MNAIILAGGRGTRLEPWHAPKCLMPIGGVAMLERLLEHLMGDVTSLVDHAIVCTGYRASDVEAAIEAHGWMRERVRCSNAGLEAPMGKRLLEARKLTDGGRVIICYGDELADVNVRRLVSEHERKSSHATFAFSYGPVTGGVVVLKDGRYLIVENQTCPVNIGFVVIEPGCWAELHPDDGLSSWINRLSCVHAFKHEGRRATVNSLADLRNAEETWR